eukprot:g3650.t1
MFCSHLFCLNMCFHSFCAEQKELVDDFNVLLRRQNRQIRISGAVLILFFAATFFALDFWTPHKWRPDVEEHVRDISAFQQIVEATCYGASDGLYEKQSVLMLVILNLLSTSLILWKGGLGKASMLCVPCLTLLYYLGHFLLVGLDTRTTCTPMLPIFTVGIHAMWIWLIGDEAVLRGHLDKLDAARYEHKSA